MTENDLLAAMRASAEETKARVAQTWGKKTDGAAEPVTGRGRGWRKGLLPAVRACAAQGLTYSETAERIGSSAKAVGVFARRHGIEFKAKRGPRA